VAEINVEPKAASVWPWVIGLLILALLVWALTELLTDEAEPVFPTTAGSVPAQSVEPAPFPAAANSPPSDAPSNTMAETGNVPDAQGMTADTAR
jgi:hypothetical protein